MNGISSLSTNNVIFHVVGLYLVEMNSNSRQGGFMKWFCGFNNMLINVAFTSFYAFFNNMLISVAFTLSYAFLNLRIV